MDNHDHPLIKIIRLSDEEIKPILEKTKNYFVFANFIEDKIASKLTAMLKDDLPSDDEILNDVLLEYHNKYHEVKDCKYHFAKGFRDASSRFSLLLAKERAEKEVLSKNFNSSFEDNASLLNEIFLLKNKCNDLTAKIEGMEKENRELKEKSKDIIADLMSCTITYCKLLEKCKGLK